VAVVVIIPLYNLQHVEQVVLVADQEKVELQEQEILLQLVQHKERQAELMEFMVQVQVEVELFKQDFLVRDQHVLVVFQETLVMEV
jgi:hypothetical protein|tara:strand:+ start:56 stop:313 length:258 start_codon:yes stop_codon:yes gene_type:complete